MYDEDARNACLVNVGERFLGMRPGASINLDCDEGRFFVHNRLRPTNCGPFGRRSDPVTRRNLIIREMGLVYERLSHNDRRIN